jgi:SAM-dependent methyltransferase
LVAPAFVQWLAPQPGRRWLDVGCGTGALSTAVLSDAAPDALVGVDPSEGYLEHARAHIADARASFRVGDALALPLPDNAVDYVVSGLVLNFIAAPRRALAEMRRVCRPGATIAAYVWDYSDGMQLIRRFWDAAVALDPAVAELDEGRRFPLCEPAALEQLAVDADLRQAQGTAIEVPTVFRDFDDYWTPFIGAQGPAPGYCASLPEDARIRLRERLRGSLPSNADGSIHLTARAWAIRATNE